MGIYDMTGEVQIYGVAHVTIVKESWHFYVERIYQ